VKSKALFSLICGLCIGVFGFVGTVAAAPDGSQRLRGLGDRVFLVNVEVIADPGGLIGVGVTFPNCYIFEADGTWIDPAFPGGPGTWEQDSVGTKTGYSASAGTAPGLVVLQEGWVTPAQGGGVLQITAHSAAQLLGLEFYSIGFEVEECPL